MREIKKKPTPIQPLDIRLRALLSLISGNDARTIDHLVKIVAKPSLSAQDLTDLKKDLLKLKPIYTDCKVWEKALTEIAVDLRRDKRTLKRLLGPVRAKRNHKPMDSLRPGSVESTASLQAADQSVTSRSQAVIEEMYRRRVKHKLREESGLEFSQRSSREACAQYPPGESGVHPEAIQYVVHVLRELRIAPRDLFDALSAQ